jgi:CrcB protein
MLAVLAVLIGGAIGTALRLGLDDLFAKPDASFPVSTLIANVVGSFALGYLVARFWPTAPGWVRAGIGPGLLGGFTTFSAVMVAMVTFASGGHVVIALVYLVVTLVAGFGAAAAGLWLGGQSLPLPSVSSLSSPPVSSLSPSVREQPIDEVDE